MPSPADQMSRRGLLRILASTAAAGIPLPAGLASGTGGRTNRPSADADAVLPSLAPLRPCPLDSAPPLVSRCSNCVLCGRICPVGLAGVKAAEDAKEHYA